MGNTDFQSIFAWIPSIFKVSDDGLDVTIQAYINGLGPRDEYENLYRLIERVFLVALPHFEWTLRTAIERRIPSSGSFYFIVRFFMLCSSNE